MNIQDIKDKVLRTTDIVSVVGRYVKLRPHGKDLVGLCPFHDERTPSFTVSKQGFFKCFGCGDSGDVIDFIMKQERKSFLEAVAYIANIQNIPIQMYERPEKAINLKEPEIKMVPKETMLKTLAHYESNPFFSFISRFVGEQEAYKLFLTKWYVGTAKNSGTIFWQIDQFLRIRTASKIHYGQDGHRLKDIQPLRLFVQGKGYQPCLFGEHQLMNARKGSLIGIVESEKSAILCDIFLPVVDARPVIWLACSGNNGLTDGKIRVLSGFDVMLVPDFSYVSRATWGCLPMRKLKMPDGKIRICEEGEEDNDYIPVARRILKHAKSVSFLDNWPSIKDGRDIADLLIEGRGVWKEPAIIPPAWDELILPEEPFS